MGIMEMGQLAPTGVVLDLLAEAMVEALYGGKAKGFLLDAYPMNLEQAAAFEDFIYSPSKIVYLSIEQDVMEGRLLERGNLMAKSRPSNEDVPTSRTRQDQSWKSTRTRSSGLSPTDLLTRSPKTS